MLKALGMYLNMNLSDAAMFNGVRIAVPEEDLLSPCSQRQELSTL